MKADLPTKDVKFTTKGQIVIPRRLREQFHIEAGTRAVIQATPEGILIKPVSRESIKRARGMLKPPPGEPSLIAQWADHKREELELEDR